MMLKLLLKIWFAIIPLLIYLIWVFISTILVTKVRIFALKLIGKEGKSKQKTKKKDYIDADYKIIDENSDKNADFRSKISLSNKNFVISIYLGVILLIFVLIFGVFFEEKNFSQTTIEDLKEKIKVE